MPLQGAVHRLFTRQARCMLIVSCQYCIVSRPRFHSCDFRAIMTSFQACKCHAIVKSHQFGAVAQRCNEQIVELHIILVQLCFVKSSPSAEETTASKHRIRSLIEQCLLVGDGGWFSKHLASVSWLSGSVDQTKQTYKFPKIKPRP